ncbi:MAG: hypothetical protein ACERLG_00895 [Sedimentibacter sp.]
MLSNEVYKNGQKTHELKDNKLIYYFLNGKVKAEGFFENGQMEGEWCFYRATGQLWQVGNFVGGKKNGTWVRYDKKDKLEYRETFENDKKSSYAENSNLKEIFQRIKLLMNKYEDPLVAKTEAGGRYELWSVKDVVIEGRKKNEVYFAGLIIQKNYVGFYFMPVYTDVEIKNVFSEELLKLLKGKSCFHIKKLDKTLEKQVADALETGFVLYKEKNWI